MPFVNFVSKNLGESKTIDYERDAIFQEGADRPWYEHCPGGYFTLTWKGHKIIISQYQAIEVFSPDSPDGRITRDIVGCYYPVDLQPYRNEIIEMIIEAFKVYGVNYGSTGNVEIIVNIDPSIKNLNPKYNFETQKFE